MFEISITEEGFRFVVSENGINVPFDDWKDTDNIIYYYSLSTLVDNGFASVIDNGCVVPFANIYSLSDDERAIIKVPRLYNKAIRVKADGLLNSPKFKYKVTYITFVPNGEYLKCDNRIGSVIQINGEPYLLPQSQFELINAIEDFNQIEESQKIFDYNLRCYNDIKFKAINAGADLDSYLGNESVLVPEKIRLRLDRDEEGYCIKPSIEEDFREGFEKAFDDNKEAQAVYNVQTGGFKRTRVVVNKEQKAALRELKKMGSRKIQREQMKDIADRVTELFNPEEFDLTDFYSDRVIEIGIYKPKFYPFVSPYKSCWIAGATIETPENGTTQIEIHSEEELDELDKKIEEAEKKNAPTIEFNDALIDIDDAKYLSGLSRSQLNQPKKPISDFKERKVLIIEENTEEVGFSVNPDTLEHASHYTLYKDDYLNDSFSLKGHQEEGIAWLQHLFEKKASGCLIADDMGLGKTLQVLYFLDWHSRQHPNHKPYIIVAPVSLLENWENEYNRFFDTPRLSINRLASKDVPRYADKSIVEKIQKMDIILTNYESLRNAQLNFCAVDYDVVVLDEAQKVKSPGTLATNAVKALKGHFKIAMTGTPVENSLLDLWCIMDFCVPGLMGNARTFARHYQAPLKNQNVDLDALGKEIHDKMGAYFIRRMKTDVAKDLPNKEVVTNKIKMPQEQMDAYVQAVNEYTAGARNQNTMLQTINNLRAISEHPYLNTEKIEECSTEELIRTSARLQATISYIDKIKERGEKVIVFALFKETQRMLQRVFHDRYGVVAKIINGDTPPVVAHPNSNRMSRQGSINYFQSVDGFNIIIMSPVAAGMGLNVTAANHVIHYSRHWNPAKEQQATDRAYRIGQDKDVFVYYPMAVTDRFRSFDETLDELLKRKVVLASSAIYPSASFEVNREEMAQMLLGA